MAFVTINVALQKYTCIHMMKAHYDTPESVAFEVQQSVKTSYIVSSENSGPLLPRTVVAKINYTKTWA